MRKITIGIDARMFSDNFTGIGRYNFELTKRFFSENFLANFLKKFPQFEKFRGQIFWKIFLNEPEFSQFSFPKNVEKICAGARHYSIREQIFFPRILKKSNCDFFHFSHFNAPIFFRQNFSVTIHDATISFFPGRKTGFLKKFFYQKVFQNAVENSRQILTVSENTKKDILQIFPKISAEKILVTHLAPSLEFCEISPAEKIKIKKKFGIEKNFLFYSGNWREHKNIAGLLDALQKILKSEKNLQLVLTGDAKKYPEILQKIEKLNLMNFVKCVGMVEFSDLKKLFSAAEIFVFPSFYEGFGLPPLEAMAAGTPVAAAKNSSIPEICGPAAIFFDPRNSDEMAEKILEIWRDENLQKKLIAAGKIRSKKFSWDATAEKTLQNFLQNFL